MPARSALLGTVLVPLWLTSPLSVAAQQTPALRRGSLVRATALAAAASPTVGRLISADPREVVLEVEVLEPHSPGASRRVTMPWDSLRSLEVSAGSHGHFGAGFAIGFALGAGTLYLAWPKQCSGLVCITPGDAAVAGALAGGLLGGLIGALSTTQRWVSVPLGGASIGLAELPSGRLGFGTTLKF